MLKMFYDQQKSKGIGEKEGDKPPGALDLFSDPKMEQFFTNGIRGGQSFISLRRAKGNDDPTKPGNHLLYVDGNYYNVNYTYIFVSINFFIF